ncbi:pilus assembly protein [Noviherbaspirillum cavernae]|nr:PilC/PilY family type IV pilus protein [Noviherbaspirillum cavernae]
MLPSVVVIAVGFASSSACAANPVVEIANGPLFSARGNVHPNMILSLSVEFPTVGVAYRGDDGSYNRTTEYVGYFNPAKCYVYNGGNRNLTDTGYFYIYKNADPVTHECDGNSFSGNFMNWAASSAIDMLRYALTGGDRIMDTADMTILQRAVLMDSGTNNFYAHSTYFPRRKIIESGNVSAPKRVTPFDVSTLYVVSCRNRILFSDQSSELGGNNASFSSKASTYCLSKYDGNGKASEEAQDKRLGEYLVRVQVCDESEGPERKDLCKRYGSRYKPVGEIQNKSDRLRLAAMGYLLDDSETRYGGVLRAPMKYVGAKKVEAPEFVPVPNDKPEWDPETGVLYPNPENPLDKYNKVVNSGVINYLNKFGRTASYKRYDPIGELYYEGIRYLQGKQATPDATTGMTEAMKDGFPVIDTWVDPLIASCQNNYVLSIADVNTHWDRYIPGNERTKYGSALADAFDATRPADSADGKNPVLDVKPWTGRVGDLETNSNGENDNPVPNTTLAQLAVKDTGSGGHGTYYMAGLAYWANTHDIRLDKRTRVKTFTIDVDEGGNGLIDNNPRSLKPRNSQLYLAAKYGGFNSDNNGDSPFDPDAPSPSWKWDKDGDGVPDNYFLAGQPQKLIESIRKVFNAAGDVSGTISGVSASSAKIASDGAYVYQPGFNSGKWTGSLKKLALTLTDDGGISIAESAVWDAGTLLTGTNFLTPNPSHAQRRIYTTKVDADNVVTTTEFKWSGLSEAQKALLNVSPVSGAVDDLGEMRVNFLRGDRSPEVDMPKMFRSRDSVLGDIINSNVAYVGAPALNGRGDGYQEFREARKNRTPAVYVGANDGMLHAFNANDGKELFAYVPRQVIGGLSQLTRPDYVHRPFVDGALTTGDAMVRGYWATVLAAGLGGGAQGVFALDITNPASFGSGNGALWEFTDADDVDMGNLTSAPVIAKFRIAVTNGIPVYKHFVVVPSGLNNYKDDGKSNSDASNALFLLSLDKLPSAQWKLGVNYYKFKIPGTDSSLQNGLATPALVTDSNGTVRLAYIGDLQGNLWRIDFSGAASLGAVQVDSAPLFTAKDATQVRQPITMQPKVVFAPGGGYVVLFGTGKFVENTDAAAGSFRAQTFYGVYDESGPKGATLTRSALAARMIEKSGAGLNVVGDTFSYGATGAQKMGWFVDFLDADKTGERAVTNPVLANGMMFFNSLIFTSDPCDMGGGRTYVLNALTGLAANGTLTGYLSQVGMLSSPVVFQTAATVGDRNSIGRRTVTKKNSVASFGTGGAKAAENGLIETAVPAGRFSWREILNWQELRDAFNK